MHKHCIVSGIGAVVKVVDSHLCGWSSTPGKKLQLLQCFMRVKDYTHRSGPMHGVNEIFLLTFLSCQKVEDIYNYGISCWIE